MLSNSLSRRNRTKGLRPLLDTLKDYPQVMHQSVQTPADIVSSLTEFAARKCDVVAISGGDGTVQAVLTALFERRPFTTSPLLAILPGGTTNMTAGDVGIREGSVKGLMRLIAWSGGVNRGNAIVRRSVLRVRPAPDADPIYGMFFGAAGIVQGIEFCRRSIESRGLTGEFGPGLALARLLLDLIRGQSEHISATSVAVGADGMAPEHHDCMVLLASTLERLFLGIRPYWGTGPGALPFSAVRSGPRHLLRALPGLLRGRANQHLTEQNGYISRRVDTLELRMDGGFTLDGELFEAQGHGVPLVIEVGGNASFVRL